MGGMSPRSGWCQRISASRPTMRALPARPPAGSRAQTPAFPVPAAGPTCAARFPVTVSAGRACRRRCPLSALRNLRSSNWLATRSARLSSMRSSSTAMLAARLAPENRQHAQNLAVARTDRDAGERSDLSRRSGHPARPRIGMLRDVRNDDRAILGQHQFEDRLLARQFPHRLAPIGFDPDSALVGKAQQHCVGFEVIRAQARDGIEAGLGRRVENPRCSQRGEPRVLLLPFDLPISSSFAASSSPDPGPRTASIRLLIAPRSFRVSDARSRLTEVRADSPVATAAGRFRRRPPRACSRFRILLIGRERTIMRLRKDIRLGYRVTPRRAECDYFGDCGCPVSVQRNVSSVRVVLDLLIHAHARRVAAGHAVVQQHRPAAR